MQPTILLPVCKHVERGGARKACRLPLTERSHKRGHVAVACKEGHQWVWCEFCCNCPTNRGENRMKGCILPSHWMERDSFDTGKRNHMQCHRTSQGLTSPSSASSDLSRVMLQDGGLLVKRRRHSGEMEPQESYLSTVLRPPAKIACLLPALEGPLPFPEPVKPLAEKQTPPSGIESGPLGTTVPLALLNECKHVDRKKSRRPCPFPLHLRSHKRGHLAVACEAGHQWVWCLFCCDCPRNGLGCKNSLHWMERDSFDTGRRNHMQRHLAGYDAKSEWSNPMNIAALANAGLIFPGSQGQALAITAPFNCNPAQQNPETVKEAVASDGTSVIEKIHLRPSIPSTPLTTAEYLQSSLPPPRLPPPPPSQEEECGPSSIENLGSISKAAEVLLALQAKTYAESEARALAEREARAESAATH